MAPETPYVEHTALLDPVDCLVGNDGIDEARVPLSPEKVFKTPSISHPTSDSFSTNVPAFVKHKESLGRPGRILSPVIPHPTDWADLVLLIPHEALRRELREIQACIVNLKYSREDVWRWLLFLKWFRSYFYPIIKAHHDNEEEIFFPIVRQRSGRDFTQNIPDDHVKLCTALQYILEGEVKLKTLLRKENIKDDEARRQLLEGMLRTLRDMVALTEEHFNEEERDLIPLVREFMTEKEADDIQMRILKRMGIVALRKELPSIVDAAQDWMTEDMYHAFSLGPKSPPRLVWWLHKLIIEPEFKMYNRMWLRQIKEGDKPLGCSFPGCARERKKTTRANV